MAAFVSLSSLEVDDEKPRKSKMAGYSQEFQAMLDSLDEEDTRDEELEEAAGSCHGAVEKKRRLNMGQVKALEKNFEVDNKLEPERKVKLAEELGLQPRQVAIWFQNRRARWKTKQLERDYCGLKSSYDSLKLDFKSLQQENRTLSLRVKELKTKLEGEERAESREYVKEECPVVSESEMQSQSLDFSEDNNNGGNGNWVRFQTHNDVSNIHSPALMNWIQFSDSRNQNHCYGHDHAAKLEEQSSSSTLFSAAEESCNFFSVLDQAPTFPWF
ncbi:unnamed protein product [Linum trigynum]|uniref:Homeobox-leucine zipper protein n=1 Tax=Linum trigynum TaxID=586398 RepID=A0AAV2ESN2_9ROSI